MSTSIAHQTISELGGPGSVLVRQRRDHIELDALIHRVERTSGIEQDRILAALSRLVFPHAFAEEAVLWPLIRTRVPRGHDLTVRIEREHQQINELFAELERTTHFDPARQTLVDNIIELLREDVRHKEDELLPALRDALSDADLVRAGRAWEAVRRIAPTRPHPVAARRPAGNAAAAAPLTVLDRTRDIVDRIVRDGPRLLSRPAAALSATLAHAAVWVEHLPLARRGEDPAARTEENRAPLGQRPNQKNQ